MASEVVQVSVCHLFSSACFSDLPMEACPSRNGQPLPSFSSKALGPFCIAVAAQRDSGTVSHHKLLAVHVFRSIGFGASQLRFLVCLARQVRFGSCLMDDLVSHAPRACVQEHRLRGFAASLSCVP